MKARYNRLIEDTISFLIYTQFYLLEHCPDPQFVQKDKVVIFDYSSEIKLARGYKIVGISGSEELQYLCLNSD